MYNTVVFENRYVPFKLIGNGLHPNPSVTREKQQDSNSRRGMMYGAAVACGSNHYLFDNSGEVLIPFI